jgi:hypothetical protein
LEVGWIGDDNVRGAFATNEGEVGWRGPGGLFVVTELNQVMLEFRIIGDGEEV